jgi:glutamate 5-kinase
MKPENIIANAKVVVVKIGSALLVDPDIGIRKAWLSALSEDIADLFKLGKSVVVVSSGAIALGRKTMGIDPNAPSLSIPLERRQGAAAVGQIALMQSYINAFGVHGMTVAQVLLTPKDTEDRRSHLNARATIHALLSENIIPVINENDTVSTAEIRFGDNDRLASRVAQMISADVVVQLSTIDGLYTADPRIDGSAEHIPLVTKLSGEHVEMAGEALPGASIGGMKSKLEAAAIATESGIPMIIGKGVEAHSLKNIVVGQARSTLFMPTDQPRRARKKWILAHVKPKGAFVLDDGACKALLDGKSLLPAGVKAVEGEFERGDAVHLSDSKGKRLGVGISAYDSDHAHQIAGHKSAEISNILGYFYGDELIHRDDLVMNG